MPQVQELLNTVSSQYNSYNPNIFLKDSRTAARMWGLKDSRLDKLPRAKFLFMVNFLRPTATNANYGDWATGISFIVKSVTRPNISFKVETLNQYNKKRVIQTGLEYEPITVSFYDTYDQRVVKMLKQYLDHYYGDFAFGTRTAWNYDVVSEVYSEETDEFGFKVNNIGSNEEYFFENIEFYQFGGGNYNKFILVHPKLVSFDYDDEDYTDTTTPQMINMRFAYEGIIMESENQPISPDLASTYGLDLGDFQEVFTSNGSIPSTNSSPLKQITSQPLNSVRQLNPVTREPYTAGQLSPEYYNPSFNPAVGTGGRSMYYDRTNPAPTTSGTLGGDFRQQINENFGFNPGQYITDVGGGYLNNRLNRVLNRATSSVGRFAPDILRVPANNAANRLLRSVTGGIFGR